MKTNFHTHHMLCGHAGGRADDYAKEAVKHGFKELGFSDHAPNDKYGFGFRMKDKDLEEYFMDIEETQKNYKNTLTIYKGLEIEHLYNEEEYYAQMMKKTDYLVLGQHFVSMNKDNHNFISSFGLSTKDQIKMYGETLCDAMRTKRYAIIAHPELYLNGYKDFDETASEVAHQICRCAEETNTILEYNANGYRRKKIDTPQGYVHPYPRYEFWNVVEQYNVKTILSSDCHSPHQLHDDTLREAEEVYRFLNTNKVTYFEEF